MSYAVRMNGEDISCKIPMNELSKLKKEFEAIEIKGREIAFTFEWEEDEAQIRGTIEREEIILDPHQHGTFKNSSDGGLEILLTRYNGSGIVSETGEEGEEIVYKYSNGIRKKGKIVFDD
jgi:hypothetical protein